MSRKAIAIFCALTMVFTQVAAISVTAADRTAPALRAATPKMNSTGISTTVKISLKFSENLYKSKYFTKIKLAKSSGSAVTITRSIYKNYLKIGHKYGLAYSTTYYLTIPAYSVKDKAGNILKKKIVVKFKTKAKAVVTHSPTPTATNSPTPTTTITPTPTSTGLETLDNLKTYYSSASDWMSKGIYLGNENTGECVINFDVIPRKTRVNATINFADSQKAVTGESSFAMTVKLSDDGKFYIRNGNDSDKYTAKTPVVYEINKSYHIKIAVHSITQKYCAWVTPDGYDRIGLASQYGFMAGAGHLNDTGKMFLISDNPGDIEIKNCIISSADTIIPSESPYPTYGATPSPTPTGTAYVTNDEELALAQSNESIGTIELDASFTYKGFSINRSVIIKGNGANVKSGININVSNVTIDNLDITASTSLVSNPIGDADHRHGYRIAPGRKGIVIKNGSITGGAANKYSSTKGIYCIPSTETEITIDNVDFSNLRNGIICGGTAADKINYGAKITIINNTFTDVAYAIGTTENATINALENNDFVNCIEGIGLGDGVSITVPGQDSSTIVNYLNTNNTFPGCTYSVKDYRK